MFSRPGSDLWDPGGSLFSRAEGVARPGPGGGAMSAYDEAVERFLAYLRDQRRVSDQTLRAYHGDLEQFGGYLAEDRPGGKPPGPEGIETIDVRGFVARLGRSSIDVSRATASSVRPAATWTRASMASAVAASVSTSSRGAATCWRSSAASSRRPAWKRHAPR